MPHNSCFLEQCSFTVIVGMTGIPSVIMWLRVACSSMPVWQTLGFLSSLRKKVLCCVCCGVVVYMRGGKQKGMDEAYEKKHATRFGGKAIHDIFSLLKQ